MTDFAKLEGALPLIAQATTNEYTKDKMDTWKVAADTYFEFYQKQENEIKNDPNNEELRAAFVELSEKLLNSCIKYDSLLTLNEKIRAEEKAKLHSHYQVMGVNAATQLLQTAQNASNSDKQDDLRTAIRYSEAFLRAMEESQLMKDFKNDQLEDWKTYAKAFRAQSYFNLKGAPEERIVSSYEALMSTKYKGIAYQALSNYYREKEDKVKQNKYLQQGIDALKDIPEQKDLRANFAALLMQNLYRGGDKEGFKRMVTLFKQEFPDDDNAVNAYLLEGEMAFENKDYATAKNIFLQAHEKYPDEPKGLLMAARAAWMHAQTNGSKKADMEDAITLFKKLEAESPTDSELWGESLYILYTNTQQPALAAPYKKYYKAKK